MRGMFKIMMVATMAASTYGGYRAVSHRRAARNPAGLAEANLGPEERRQAAARFSWRGRRRGHDEEARQQDESPAAPQEAAAET